MRLYLLGRISTRKRQKSSVESFVEFFIIPPFLLLWQSSSVITNLCSPHERREMQFFTWLQVPNQFLLNISTWPTVILFPFFRMCCSFPLAHLSTCAPKGCVILTLYVPWISIKKNTNPKNRWIAIFRRVRLFANRVYWRNHLCTSLRLPVRLCVSTGPPWTGFHDVCFGDCH